MVPGDVFRLGEWLVERQLNQIQQAGEVRRLQPKVMDVLCYLARHAGEVVPKERIIQALWSDAFVSDEVLTYSIGELRKALGDDAQNPTYIETIPRRGYRLIAPVLEETRVAESRYQVLEEIGRGAMGKVFLAEDQLLRRRVALKFLVGELEEDPKARRRFLREARAAASLEHPYICTVHDTGELGGQTYIAMEYVEGQTLRERLVQGPLTLEEGLRTAVEIAEALEKAHAAGIIHRDLKPGNIMLTPEGHPKLMDFGLAKRILKEDETGQDLSSTLTRERATVGTLSYMSPEQVRGDRIDPRSDLFSFGIVLYEMLTGVHPFRGTGSAETMSNILKDDPAPLTDHLEKVPQSLEQLIRRMLAKDAAGRYPSAGELRQDLEKLCLAPGPTVSTAVRRPFRWLPVAGAVAVLALLISAVLWYSSRELEQPEAAVSLEFKPLTHGLGFVAEPSWSPKGDFVAYSGDRSGNMDIWLVSLNGGGFIQRTRDRADDVQPDWSPDGRQIVFRSERDGGGLFLMEAISEAPPRKIVSFGVQPRWSPDGKSILFVEEDRGVPGAQAHVYSGSRYRSLPFLPGTLIESFQWHPNSRCVTVLSTGHFTSDSVSYWPELWILDLETEEGWQRSEESDDFVEEAGRLRDFYPRPFYAWLPSGDRLLLGATVEGSYGLWEIPVDPQTFRLELGPRRLASLTGGIAEFDLSSDGQRVVFVDLHVAQRVWRYTFDALRGELLGDSQIVSPLEQEAKWVNLSRDGRKLAFCAWTNVGDNVRHLYELDLETTRQIVVDLNGYSPRWSPDGSRLAFKRDFGIYAVEAGGGQPEKIATLPEHGGGGPSDWSSDGKWLLWEPTQIERLPLEAAPQAEKQAEVLASHPDFYLFQAQYSPRERWISFMAVSKGRTETSQIFVMPASGGDWTPVTSGEYFDDKPRWSPDGRIIYFTSNRAGPFNVWGIPFDPDRGRPAGEPFQVTRFHTRSRMLLEDLQANDFSLSRDSLFLPLVEKGGDLWILEPEVH